MPLWNSIVNSRTAGCFHCFTGCIHMSSIIRQKGKSQNRCFKKLKHAKFSEKRTFLIPWYAHVGTHTYVCVSRGKKCLFFRNICVLCFLETPVLRFALLAYYRRIWGYIMARFQISATFWIVWEIKGRRLLSCRCLFWTECENVRLLLEKVRYSRSLRI